MTAHLSIAGLTKRFGGVLASDNISLDFAPGSLTAVIGPNGAGKTTFFNLISGKLRPDAGVIRLDGVDIAGHSQAEIVRRGIGRAFQVASIFPQFTVEEALGAAVLTHRHKTGSLFRRFPRPDAVARAREIMALTGLERVARTPSRFLSHGDQKLLDLALALALEPRVLLLDEPTAGMGPEERWQMIERVQRLWSEVGMTLVFIEHDMDIVFRIAQTIRVLRYGAVLAEGTPDEIRNNEAVIEAYLGASLEAHP